MTKRNRPILKVNATFYRIEQAIFFLQEICRQISKKGIKQYRISIKVESE